MHCLTPPSGCVVLLGVSLLVCLDHVTCMGFHHNSLLPVTKLFKIVVDLSLYNNEAETVAQPTI